MGHLRYNRTDIGEDVRVIALSLLEHAPEGRLPLLEELLLFHLPAGGRARGEEEVVDHAEYPVVDVVVFRLPRACAGLEYRVVDIFQAGSAHFRNAQAGDETDVAALVRLG